MKSLNEFSLVDPETIMRPYEYYARMRAEEAVHFDERAHAYLVTRYEDLQQAARMTVEFSNELGFAEALRPDYQDEIDELMRREGHGPHVIGDNFQVDPPLHARRRGLVDQAFNAHRVAGMEDHIGSITSELMDRFIDRGQVDLVQEYAIPVAIYVISDILNVPRDRVEDVKRWSDAAVAPIGRGVSKERAIAYAHDLMDMHAFLAAEIEKRRAAPGDDLISDLVRARIDDPQNPQLSFAELLSICVAMLAAGNETTRNAISFGSWILAKNPDLVEKLRLAEDQNKTLLRFVEEVLRLEPPVPQLPRVATRDCELGGVLIPKGSHVFLCWASGNRDKAKFEKPDDFDMDRKGLGQHVTFGAGIHRCIGAMLARMEMKCAFREIVNRMTDIRLAVADEDVPIWGTFVFRGPTSLPVTFRQR